MLIPTIIIGLSCVAARACLIPTICRHPRQPPANVWVRNWTTLLINKDSSFAAKLVRACVSVHANQKDGARTVSFVSLGLDYVTKF